MESGGSGSVRGAGREKKKGKNADDSSVAAVAGEPGGSGGGKPRKFVSSVEREGGHLPYCRGIWGNSWAELPYLLFFGSLRW